MFEEPNLVMAKVVRVFDALQITYVVGGSVASSLYGIPRVTRDVDLVADIRLDHAEAITEALVEEFYVDADMIKDAVRRRASFNVIHLATMFKADIFVFKGDSWSHEEMARARTHKLDVPDGKVTIRFASPEDTLLHKLVWYKLGNEVSDRQWGDVQGLIEVQGEALDHQYLDRWAPALDVVDLLARARQQHRGNA
jgi:hypothetical protein